MRNKDLEYIFNYYKLSYELSYDSSNWAHYVLLNYISLPRIALSSGNMSIDMRHHDRGSWYSVSGVHKYYSLDNYQLLSCLSYLLQ